MTEADLEYLVHDKFFSFVNYTGKPDVEAYNESLLRGFDMRGFYDELTQIWGDEGYQIYEHTIYIHNDSATMQFEAVNADGKKITMYRSFTRKGDKTDVHHDLFDIPVKSQGSGLSKRTFQALFKQYDQMGHINSVNLTANLDVGGYAWARYGFATTEDQLDEIFQDYSHTIKALNKSRRRKGEELVKVLDKDELAALRKRFDEIIKEKAFVRDGVTYIDMRDLSEVPNAKCLLLGSEWRGVLFYDNEKQLLECHSYFRT
jgi:hypothetical protein